MNILRAILLVFTALFVGSTIADSTRYMIQDGQPLETRWVAKMTYPERLQDWDRVLVNRCISSNQNASGAITCEIGFERTDHMVWWGGFDRVNVRRFVDVSISDGKIRFSEIRTTAESSKPAVYLAVGMMALMVSAGVALFCAFCSLFFPVPLNLAGATKTGLLWAWRRSVRAISIAGIAASLAVVLIQNAQFGSWQLWEIVFQTVAYASPAAMVLYFIYRRLFNKISAMA